MSNKYLRNRLCIAVKGFNRAVVYDLTRQDYHFIPVPLFDIIAKDDILSFDNELDGVLFKEWEKFLLEHEIIFPVGSNETSNMFPNISIEFSTPYDLGSMVIHNNLRKENLEKFANLSIQNIALIVDTYNKRNLYRLLQNIAKLNVESINVYIADSLPVYRSSELITFRGISEVFNIYLFKNATYINEDKEIEDLRITRLPYDFTTFCSVMTKEKLQINIDHYLESLNNHNYYNGKLYIDEIGNIKNGLNDNDHFGNIGQIDYSQLVKIISSEHFRANWTIKKVNTLICKDCEFRYMCVDPRVLIRNTEGYWYSSNECSYNPYLSKWSTDENFRSLAESGINLDASGNYSIDQNVLARAFEACWS